MLEGTVKIVALLPGIAFRDRPRYNSILGHAHIVRFIRITYFRCGRGLGRGTFESLPVPSEHSKNLATMSANSECDYSLSTCMIAKSASIASSYLHACFIYYMPQQ